MKRVLVFVYSSMRELRQCFHSLPGCLPSFSGFPRPTTAWHGSEMGRRGQWHQRMDIKRRAQLGPATIVRCGHSRLCQASQSCQRTVTGAASRLSLHIHQLGGHKGAFSLMACVMADGCLGQEGSECAQRPWSVVALGVEKEYCLSYSSCIGQFWAQTHLDRKLQWNIHTMQSPDYCGNPVTHARRWERLTTNECKLFTVFLI